MTSSPDDWKMVTIVSQNAGGVQEEECHIELGKDDAGNLTTSAWVPPLSHFFHTGRNEPNFVPIITQKFNVRNPNKSYNHIVDFINERPLRAQFPRNLVSSISGVPLRTLPEVQTSRDQFSAGYSRVKPLHPDQTCFQAGIPPYSGPCAVTNGFPVVELDSDADVKRWIAEQMAGAPAREIAAAQHNYSISAEQDQSALSV
ncbi:hypothetical protein THAOC_31058, partial [Thalassiosira oceanica]